MQMQQKMQPRLVLRQAVVRQPVVPSHARPARPWLGQVHQLGQLNPVRPMAMPVAMPTPIVKAVVKPVVKPLQWVYAAPLQSTPGHSINPKVVLCGRCGFLVLACLVAPTSCDPNQTRYVKAQEASKHDPGRFARARSGKRAIPAVPGIAPLARSCPNPSHGSPHVESLGTSRLWHCFCQYSAHRAEPYALNIGRMPRSAGPEISPHISGHFWPIFKASWSHAL